MLVGTAPGELRSTRIRVRWIDGLGNVEREATYDPYGVTGAIAGVEPEPGVSNAQPVAAYPLPDGGLLVVANEQRHGAARHSGWLVWLDAAGAPLAERQLSEQVFAVLPDGPTGLLAYVRDADARWSFVGLDAEGHEVSRLETYTAASDYIGGIARGSGGRLAALGGFTRGDGTELSASLDVFEPEGGLAWARWFDSGCRGEPLGIVAHPSGGFVVAVSAPGPAPRVLATAWLVHLDEDGALLRRTQLPVVPDDTVRLVADSEGFLVAAGVGNAWWVASLDADLGLRWARAYEIGDRAGAPALHVDDEGVVTVAGGAGVVRLRPALPCDEVRPAGPLECGGNLERPTHVFEAGEGAFSFSWPQCPAGTSVRRLSLQLPPRSAGSICLETTVAPASPPPGYRFLDAPIELLPTMRFEGPATIGLPADPPLEVDGSEVVLHDAHDGRGYRVLETRVDMSNVWFTAEVGASGSFVLAHEEAP